MNFSRRAVVVPGLLILFLMALLNWSRPVSAAEDAAAQKNERPRLLVLVVFDQLRGDYLIRWEKYFGDGGFRRLQKEGAWFQNCHYPYAGTLTGAGHASLLTGCAPARHGIVGNDWFELSTGQSVNCVSSIRHQRVPALTESDPRFGKKDGGQVSPERMVAESFGDVLKQQTKGEGKVVGLSFKDRSAVLPAGRQPDACYWFDSKSGSFITSTYYGEALHPWVVQYNSERPGDAWFDKPWTRFRGDLDYDEVVGPDDVEGEGSGSKQGRTFPHPLNGGLEKPGDSSYEALYNSPFGNDLLLEFARRAIVAEELGADDIPDLLTVSFSSNDAVGHTWGPDSQEVFDITLRSDGIVRDLLNFLDEKVGKGRYTLALSADHGVCPIPEVAKEKGISMGRLSSKEFLLRANEYLEACFGGGHSEKPVWIKTNSNKWLVLDHKKLAAAGVPLEEARRALADWSRKWPGIEAVYTPDQLQGELPSHDILARRSALSFFPDRSGDVFLVTKPYWLVGEYSTGTTHGSPWGYDTHVPLLAYGPGITPGIRQDRVPPAAIAPIFSRAIGASPPKECDTPLPEGLFALPAQ